MEVLLSEWLPTELMGSLVELFSEKQYLEMYDDVRASGGNAFTHYLDFGWNEGRIFPLKRTEDSIVLVESFADLKGECSSLFDAKFADALKLEIAEYQFQRGVIDTIFDPQYYEKQLSFDVPNALKLEHFMVVGRFHELSPNSYFVPNEYAKIYSDIAESDIDETFHFAAQGLKEGRYPRILDTYEKFQNLPEQILYLWTAEFFDSDYYLENNKDVTASGIEPLHHYCHTGWKEGRSPSAIYSSSNETFDIAFFATLGLNPLLVKNVLSSTGFSLQSKEESFKLFGQEESVTDDELAYEINLLDNQVDNDFYFRLYPDVKESGLTAVEHFCKYGWKELRDPSADFSTEFYLSDNPDVREAGVNPLFHYIVAGQFERRYSRRPGGIKADSIYHLVPLSKKKEHWNIADRPECLLPPELSINEKSVISISHDRYTEHTGGVQLCILKEQKAFNADGVDYIHLAPFQPLPTLSDANEFFEKSHYLHLTINGDYKGVIQATDFIDALQAKNDADLSMIYHAFHGHSTEFLEQLVALDKVSQVYLWIHDYFTICEGYNLLRNEVSPCGAPKPESKSCGICVFGQERSKHLARINELLSKKPFTAIAPSEAAKETWLADNGAVDRIKLIDIVVKEHITLKKEKTTRVEKNKSIKVAFIGYPSIHKGWAEFSEFVRRTLATGLYEYYHIGAEKSELPGVNFVECSVTAKNPELMVETVRLLDVDYVYIAAPWAETFNIVCYEVIAAGALVITHPASGNVARFVSASGNGLIVNSVEELILDHEKLLKKPTEKTYYSTQFSDMGHGI